LSRIIGGFPDLSSKSEFTISEDSTEFNNIGDPSEAWQGLLYAIDRFCVQKQREAPQVPIDTGLQSPDSQVPQEVKPDVQALPSDGVGPSDDDVNVKFKLPEPVLTVEDLKAFTAKHPMSSEGSIESPPDGQPGIIQSQAPPLEQTLQEGDPASLSETTLSDSSLTSQARTSDVGDSLRSL
jgi:hypothetical protein